MKVGQRCSSLSLLDLMVLYQLIYRPFVGFYLVEAI
jgi:hypothetical protein